MNMIDVYLDKLGFKSYYDLPVMKTISKKTGLQPSMIIVAFVAILAILSLSSFLGNIITTLVAFLLPALHTFEALESGNTDSAQRLLTYWVVFGVVYSLDELLRGVLRFIPFFHVFRCAFLISLFIPKLNGAQLLYSNVIRPFLLKYRSEIDKLVVPLEQKSQKVGQNTNKGGKQE